ncbi:MAG TPA: peptide-methionine (S)-S-oxide reductase MsrA [Steroidobacteraceae bacterium]|nr:peptide-methionine (S)-S-oxide reductase MsrA [Steroidobacteraceae bacterium]
MARSPMKRAALQVAAALLLCAGVLAPWHARAGESALVIAAPILDEVKAPGPAQTVVLSGGCFWGVQGIFEHLRGVQRVVAGYAGGGRSTAQYEAVSTGSTGHAESVQISYDPAQVSLGEILQVFFSVVHDPTQLNRQGPDSGSQYRSEIFYGNATQQRIAAAYIAQLSQSHAFARPIVTRVDSLPGFYPAEDYHQDFLIHHPNYPYIVYNDLPKIENFKRVFPAYYVREPALVSNVAPR